MTYSNRVVLGRPGNRTAVLIRRTISLAVTAIAALAFAFSFGNAWILGLQLGVPHWVAPLTGPAVDLSVLALLVSMQYVRTQGTAARLLGPRLLLIFCGLVTLIINVAKALFERHFGRAAYDSVSPLLLIFWGEVGPELLSVLHTPIRDVSDDMLIQEEVHKDSYEMATMGENVEQKPGVNQKKDLENSLVLGRPTVPDDFKSSPELLARAWELDRAHRETTGRPLSRDRLRAALGISNALAGELVRVVRSFPDGPVNDGRKLTPWRRLNRDPLV